MANLTSVGIFTFSFVFHRVICRSIFRRVETFLIKTVALFDIQCNNTSTVLVFLLLNPSLVRLVALYIFLIVKLYIYSIYIYSYIFFFQNYH